MNFSELLDVAYDERSGRVDSNAIEMLLPNTPAAVRDVYSDHGRKEAFQAQYGTLDIGGMSWEHVLLPASEIVGCSIHDGFTGWTSNVAHRVARFGEMGWRCIDVRPYVVDHWSQFQTWIDPPILLDASLVGRPSGLHLVEGHTRIGILSGLISYDVLRLDSQHSIWRGISDTVRSKK
jgi:hypothetical protein